MSHGIEIHHDEERGYLELACESEAFEEYRELAHRQLADLPEIPIDSLIEINIVDTARYVARRDAPSRRFRDLAIVAGIIVTLIFAIAGVGHTIALILKRI